MDILNSKTGSKMKRILFIIIAALTASVCAYADTTEMLAREQELIDLSNAKWQ